MALKQAVLDNVLQAVAGVLCAAAVPLAAQFPGAASYIAIAAGGVAFLMGKMYPNWSEGVFKP